MKNPLKSKETHYFFPSDRIIYRKIISSSNDGAHKLFPFSISHEKCADDHHACNFPLLSLANTEELLSSQFAYHTENFNARYYKKMKRKMRICNHENCSSF